MVLNILLPLLLGALWVIIALDFFCYFLISSFLVVVGWIIFWVLVVHFPFLIKLRLASKCMVRVTLLLAVLLKLVPCLLGLMWAIFSLGAQLSGIATVDGVISC